uniref:Mos1 transposase HTH domain-containing protein n=1 Tax=Trichuris muris TaxID=70415 RepID=A0A5S6Q867_TRIMR
MPWVAAGGDVPASQNSNSERVGSLANGPNFSSCPLEHFFGISQMQIGTIVRTFRRVRQGGGCNETEALLFRLAHGRRARDGQDQALPGFEEKLVA